MMQAAAFLTAICLWTLQVPAETLRLPSEANPQVGGFVLRRGTCELGQAYCERREPKDWTTFEIDLIRQAVESISSRPTGKAVLAEAQRLGFNTLRRYARAIPGPEGVARAQPTAGLHRNRMMSAIDINDAYFLYSGVRDAHSGTPGYSIPAQILLHEAFHAIDRHSAGARFRELAGFVEAGSEVRFAIQSPSDAMAFADHDRRLAMMIAADDHKAMRAFNREAALGMRPVRIPSMQATRSPAEAFAEIGSHLILDPRARMYLPREVVSYFESVVFASVSTPGNESVHGKKR